MCVRHTTADAYNWGYKIIIPKDATDSFTKEDYEYGLNYLKTCYGAEITMVDEIIKKVLRHCLFYNITLSTTLTL
jgi:nicotinamidase-related amidase